MENKTKCVKCNKKESVYKYGFYKQLNLTGETEKGDNLIAEFRFCKTCYKKFRDKSDKLLTPIDDKYAKLEEELAEKRREEMECAIQEVMDWVQKGEKK